MKYCTVGIDTSNYTTSVAAVDENLGIIANLKYPLPVRAGECGLRQSDAVFAHTKNLPEAFAALAPLLSEYTPIAVGVSEKPRNQEGSYMPCFLTGISAAEGISAVAGIPCYRFSHQCGHLMAAILGADPFGAVRRFSCLRRNHRTCPRTLYGKRILLRGRRRFARPARRTGY